MADKSENRCLYCGKDCSFIAHCEGCCIPCGDALVADPHKLLLAYVKTCQISQDNGRDAMRWRKMLGQLAQPGGSRDGMFIWLFRAIVGPHANLNDAIDAMGE